MKSDDTIFLINSKKELERIPHRKYVSEEIFQELIEKHPELIVGEQIDPDNPPRWLLIKREAGIPDAEGGSGRWSVDHLLLDQSGRPTFVEVKRSSDTRIRREVVGQMLDYAANAKVYWPTDKIRALAADQWDGQEGLEVVLSEFLKEGGDEEEVDTESYWKSVESHLRNGEVRLLFVADEIPTELRRIIEFLNEHMPQVEVLGVEIRQYEGQDINALVPRVVGQTEFARQEKRTGGRTRKTTEDEFLSLCPELSRKFFSEILHKSKDYGYTINWGIKGFSLRLPTDQGTLMTVFYGYPPGVNGSDYPLFQTYLEYVEDPGKRERVRKEMVQLAKFEERGHYTLQIPVKSETEESLRENIGMMLDAARRIALDD